MTVTDAPFLLHTWNSYENVLKRRECLSFTVIAFDDYDSDHAIVIIISALQWFTSTFHTAAVLSQVGQLPTVFNCSIYF